MLAQVLGAERERFLLGAKNTYILEGNWPSGAAFGSLSGQAQDPGRAYERGKRRGTEPFGRSNPSSR